MSTPLRILSQENGDQPTMAELVNELRMARMMLERIAEKMRTFNPEIGTATQQQQARRIVAEVARFYNYSATQIHSRTRTEPLAWARHVAIALIREFTGMSLHQIARLMELDHSSVLHAIKHVASRCETEEAAAAAVARLREKIKKQIDL